MNRDGTRKKIGWISAIAGAISSVTGIVAAGVICGPVCILGPLVAVLGIGIVGFLYRYSAVFTVIGIILFLFGILLITQRNKFGYNCIMPAAEATPSETKPEKSRKVNVVIITGSCCIPSMAAFDEQAQRIIKEAVSNANLMAQIKIVPATTAFMGGAPKEIISKLMADYNKTGHIGLPVVLINGKIISYGVPKAEDIKSALEGVNTNEK